MSTKHVVILKNDAVGDLVHSLKSIYNVTNNNDFNKITIFVSKLSKKFDFLFKNSKVNTKVINYNLTVLEKLNLFLFFLINRIDRVYILSPKNFYYYLPLVNRQHIYYHSHTLQFHRHPSYKISKKQVLNGESLDAQCVLQ